MKRNFLTFNDLGEEYAQYAQDLRRGTPTAVFGVSDPLKYLLASMIDVPVLYVTADALSAKKAADKRTSPCSARAKRRFS